MQFIDLDWVPIESNWSYINQNISINITSNFLIAIKNFEKFGEEIDEIDFCSKKVGRADFWSKIKKSW